MRTPGEPGETGRPTLGDLRLQLKQTGTPAAKNQHVMAFRETVGAQSSLGNRIAAAVDALVRGNTASRVEAWFHELPKQGRPTLRQLCVQLRQGGASAPKNPHVSAFRDAPGESSNARTHILSALNALVRSDAARSDVVPST